MKGALCMCLGCIGLSACPFSIFIQWIGCQNVGNASCISLPWLPWTVSIIWFILWGTFNIHSSLIFLCHVREWVLLLARWQWKWYAGFKLGFGVVAYICPFITVPTWYCAFFACLWTDFWYLVKNVLFSWMCVSMHINNCFLIYSNLVWFWAFQFFP